jgi:hypothetical protein
MNLRKIRWGSVDWIQLVQDRDRWRTLVNTVMYMRVLEPQLLLLLLLLLLSSSNYYYNTHIFNKLGKIIIFSDTSSIGEVSRFINCFILIWLNLFRFIG